MTNEKVLCMIKKYIFKHKMGVQKLPTVRGENRFEMRGIKKEKWWK